MKTGLNTIHLKKKIEFKNKKTTEKGIPDMVNALREFKRD
jgi:hypothetical protein